MPTDKPDLEAAYALQTPDDNKRLYADWAQSYDSTFADKMDYQMPRLVAAQFARFDQGDTPVLDVGAGTGLVAEHLNAERIDALDISAEMLAVAGQKRLYSRLIEGDLTATLPVDDTTYGGLISAGTFTHGHVGPAALDELLRVAKSGALFVLAINDAHFEARGFAAKFEALAPDIRGLQFEFMPIYGAGNMTEHAADQARIAAFRKN